VRWRRLGGSFRLSELVDLYGEWLVSDFQHYYQLDLRDIFTGRLSAKRALVLIDNLPPASATVAQMRGGQQFRGWDDGRYLNWMQTELVQQLLFAFVCANTDSKNKPKPPKNIYQPKTAEDILKEKLERQAKPGSFASFISSGFAEIRKKKGAD
jgi:hypothetical protein